MMGAGRVMFRGPTAGSRNGFGNGVTANLRPQSGRSNPSISRSDGGRPNTTGFEQGPQFPHRNRRN